MQKLGDYELKGQIGAGSSGTVWMAHRRGPVEQTVALKRLRAGSSGINLGRIKREASVLTELGHPNIMQVLEVLEDGDGIALAMEFAPGGSLEQVLVERGRLPAGEVVGVAAPVAEALATAHRRGILHGDVKPANVLFGSDGEPLLSDFGGARLLAVPTSPHVVSAAEYLAPELLDGASPDPRSDVYSLGVVCYEAFTGHAPELRGRHQPLAQWDVPPPMADVIERAIARDPRQRFSSADEMAWSLRRSLPHEKIRLPDVAAMAPSPGEGRHTRHDGTARPPRHAAADGNRRFMLPVATSVLIVGAGAAFLLLGPLGSGGSSDCPQVQRPAVDPGGQLLAGDPEGDGCATYGTYQLHSLAEGQQSMLLSIVVNGQERRLGVGDPGDQLFLGDWNCDGTDTPGLYRREVGELQYFEEWTAVGGRLDPDRSERVPVGGMSHLDLVDDADQDQASGDCDRMTITAP